MSANTISRRNLLQAAGISAGLAFLPGRAFSAAPAIFGIGSIDINYAPIYAAFAKGYFADAGLTTEYLNAQSGPRAKQMLAAGQIMAACSGASDSVALTMAGKESVLVYSLERRTAVANIIVSKAAYDSGVRSVKDLAGKKIGITQPQSLTWLLATEITSAAGLGGTVELRPLGDLTTMLGAVKSGSVDGCIATFSMLDAAEAEGWGVPIFRSYNDDEWNSVFQGDLPGIGIYVLKETIDSRPDDVEKFVKGLVAGTEFVKKASDEEIAALIHENYLPNQPATAMLSSIRKFRSTWSADNTFDKAAYKNMMSLMGSDRMYSDADLATRAKFDDLVNNSFVLKARGKA